MDASQEQLIEAAETFRSASRGRAVPSVECNELAAQALETVARMKNATHDLLRKIVADTKCKPGWSFSLREDNETGGLVLHILIRGTDNYNPDQPFAVYHPHPVPYATYNEATWRRWIFEQCIRSMNHETGESLRFGDKEERPFEPCHGPGEDPYTVHEFRDPRDARITQNGSMR